MGRILILFAFLSVFAANAQQYSFTQFSVEEGLVQSEVQAVFQDQQGFIWVGTRGGLSRFDGQHFQTMLRELKVAVLAIDQTKDGMLVIGTDKGLVTIHDTTLIFNEDDGIGDNTVRNVAVVQNEVYILTKSRLSKLVNGKIVAFPYEWKDARGLDVDDQGDVYLQDRAVVYKISGNTVDTLFTGDLSVLDLKLDHEGKIWLSNWNMNHLMVWDGEQARNYDHVIQTPVTSLYVANNGDIWAASWDKGVFKVSHEIITRYSMDNGLQSNSFWGVVEDSEHNMWFGSFGGGIIKFSPPEFWYYTEQDHIPGKIINAVYTSSDTTLWIGTENGVVKGKIGLSNEFVPQKAPELEMLRGKKITCFKQLSDGDMLIGIYDQEMKMARVTSSGRVQIYGKRLRTAVFSIHESEDGTIWCGTDGFGVFKITDSVEVILPAGIKARVINIYEDADGHLWLCTINNGLFVYDKGEFLKVEAPYLNQSTASGIVEINNEYWIATEQHGIYITTLKEPCSLLLKDSLNKTNVLKSNSVGGVKQLQNGDIWLGTSRGIYKVTIANGERDIQYFGRQQGMPVNETSFNPFELYKGNLVIATNEGLVLKNISDMHEPPRIKALLLQDILLSFEPYQLVAADSTGFPDKLSFAYDENHLTFNMSALHFTFPELVQYRFRMKGLDKDWSPWDHKGQIVYSSLPHGNFILEVEARLDGIEGSGISRSVPVNINPPFWLTKTFVITSVVLTILIIILTFRWRTNKLRRDRIKLEAKVEERTLEVVRQKEEIEHKNREITDSIQYAKRLQDAILPPNSFVNKHLPQSFILYKPKDIVAGDFYWMETEGDTVYFAAADCTGHGVPGAMVSVVCSGALDRSVKEFGCKTPGEILDKTRELVIAKFEKSEADVKDGMDIALCALNLSDSVLQYAGANNPLYHIRKLNGKQTEKDVQNEAYFLHEIKADKQPIGKYMELDPYTTQTIQLEQGDSIYIFSDGFADQFGGEKGKKFKYKPFKRLLLEIHNKPLEQQKRWLDKAFEDWRGNHEQIDDVCVFGVKIA